LAVGCGCGRWLMADGGVSKQIIFYRAVAQLFVVFFDIYCAALEI